MRDKDIKDNCFIKMPTCLINIFDESKDSNYFTNIYYILLTSSYTNPGFFLKSVNFYKQQKPLTYSQTPSYISGNIL